MLKAALTAAVRLPDVTVRVSFVPFLSILQPVNMATPEMAVLGSAVQVRLAAAAGGVMLRVTTALLAVTVLPPASWTATTGWVARTRLAAAPEGCVVKASLAAGPTVMVKLVLAAVVSDPEAAVRV
jgi:hypothetical protein